MNRDEGDGGDKKKNLIMRAPRKVEVMTINLAKCFGLNCGELESTFVRERK
jgi:hypothetical protein